MWKRRHSENIHSANNDKEPTYDTTEQKIPEKLSNSVRTTIFFPWCLLSIQKKIDKQLQDQIIRMVIAYHDIMELLKVLTEDGKMQVTVKESGKGALVAGTMTGLGEL